MALAQKCVVTFVVLISVGFANLFAETASPFKAEIDALLAARAVQVPPKDPVIFYGSSNLRLWGNLNEVFAPLPCVNLSFGGAQSAHLFQEIDSLVFPLQPKVLVLYAGSNDVEGVANAQELKDRLHLSAKGYEVFRELLKPLLQKTYDKSSVATPLKH